MPLMSRFMQRAGEAEGRYPQLHFATFSLPFTSYFFPFCGGIAQLVERQLCKLDVRGSNPLASNEMLKS
jgi:hypothetical protein